MSAQKSARAARLCAVALITALFCTLWGWQWLCAPTWRNALWAAVASVPMLIPLPGILQGKRRAFALATLCLTPYFVAGISESIVNPSARAWAIAMLGLTLLLFFALIACLRLPRS